MFFVRIRPHDVAGVVHSVLLFHRAGVQNHGQHQHRRRGPGHGRDYFGYVQGAVSGGGDWMAHGYVAVRRHNQQEYRGREGCDGGADHVGLAHELPEPPAANPHRVEQKGNANQEALVRHRQIQDVNIRNRLHLGEPQHHIYYQCVAKQANDADYSIEDDCEKIRQGVPGGYTMLVGGQLSAVDRLFRLDCGATSANPSMIQFRSIYTLIIGHPTRAVGIEIGGYIPTY